MEHRPHAQFYTGLIPLVLAITMLFEKRIDKRLRALTLVFAGFLVVSSVPGLFMHVWCGFRQPNGFYCRIAFLLSFLEIWAAALLLMKRAVCRSRVSDSQTVSWTEVGSRPKYANPTIHRLVPLDALLLAILDLGFNVHACWNQPYINYPQDTHDTYVDEVDAQIRELKPLKIRTIRMLTRSTRRYASSSSSTRMPSTGLTRPITGPAPRLARACRTDSTSYRHTLRQTVQRQSRFSMLWGTARKATSPAYMPPQTWSWIACLACSI